MPILKVNLVLQNLRITSNQYILTMNYPFIGGISYRSREPGFSRPKLVRSARYASSPAGSRSDSSHIGSSVAPSTTTNKRTEYKKEFDVDDAPHTFGEKRKSLDSEVDSSDRPARRSKLSSDAEYPHNFLQNLRASQFHGATKAQKASCTNDKPLHEEAFPSLPSQIGTGRPRVRGKLSSLQFRDAMSSETGSVRGPETSDSAGSIASPHRQNFGDYQEGAGLGPFTIAGISSPVSLAQEALGVDFWEHHEPRTASRSYFSEKEHLKNMLTRVPNSPSARIRNSSIEHESQPRPLAHSPAPWMSIQPRARMMTNTEAFTPSPIASTADPSPLSPVGNPLDMDRLSIRHPDSVEIFTRSHKQLSPFHFQPPPRLTKSPSARSSSPSRQQSHRNSISEGVFHSIKRRLGSTFGGFSNIPFINFIPRFNELTVSTKKDENELGSGQSTSIRGNQKRKLESSET